LVIDCSVLVKWELAGEEHTAAAMALFHEWQAGRVALHAPDLLPSEIGSAFLRTQYPFVRFIADYVPRP
jgi:hypothetical protein